MTSCVSIIPKKNLLYFSYKNNILLIPFTDPLDANTAIGCVMLEPRLWNIITSA